MEFFSDEIDGDVLILQVDGGLNRQTAEQFVESIEKLVDTGLTKLIIDCAGLDYVSSYGLGLLVRLHHRLKGHGGDVKICNVRGPVPQLLKMTRLNTVLAIYPDVNQARLAFRSPEDAETREHC